MHSNKRRVQKASFALSALLTLMVVCLVFGSGALRVSAETTDKITDNGKVSYYTTSATDPRTVLGEAGLTLDEDDTYTTQAGIGTSEITVRRSQTIFIFLNIFPPAQPPTSPPSK